MYMLYRAGGPLSLAAAMYDERLERVITVLCTLIITLSPATAWRVFKDIRKYHLQS
jgi:hypothetical protein